MRKAMVGAVALGLAFLMACSRDIGIPGFAGTDTAVDTGADGVGDLSVTYVLIDSEAVSCEDAGVSILHVIAEGPEDPIEVDYPCDGEEIRFASVPVGTWVLTLRGEGAGGTVFVGGTDAELTVDGIAVDAELNAQ